MLKKLLFNYWTSVLVWEGGGDLEENREEGAEAAVWSNSSALAVDARRAVRCGARLMRVQWRRVDTGGAASWRDADLTSLHHQREVPNSLNFIYNSSAFNDH